MKAKGIFASTEAMVGAIAFSLIFLAFSANSLLAQMSASRTVAGEAAYIAASTRLQHSIFLIDRLGMNMSEAASQLNYDMGASNYSIMPFASSYIINSSISRVVAIGNIVYYVNVNVNGS